MTRGPNWKDCSSHRCPRDARIEHGGVLYCESHDPRICAYVRCERKTSKTHHGRDWCDRHYPPTFEKRCAALFKPVTIHA